MASYFLDTTALIDYLNGRPETVKTVKGLASEGHLLGICCINITEVYAGLKEHERKPAERLLGSLHYYDVTAEVAAQAGAYINSFARRGISLSASDAIIAATAIANQATLVTANIRHYPMPEIALLALPTK
ncbi:MAG: PIN domain-containing protein [Anaerolineae bacterium]